MRKNEIFNVKNLTRLALVAAAYVALTLMVYPLEYGPIQLRFSEILVLLCFYRKDYAVSLTVGCLIANLFSPYGLLDVILGTLATAIAVFPMYYTKNIWLAAILPIVSNSIIVGFDLFLCGEPLWFSMGTVALGELVVIGILGTVVFKFILERNHAFMRIIGSTRRTAEKTAEV